MTRLWWPLLGIYGVALSGYCLAWGVGVWWRWVRDPPRPTWPCSQKRHWI